MLGSSLNAFLTRRTVHVCDHPVHCLLPFAPVASSLASKRRNDSYCFCGTELQFTAQNLFLLEEVEHWFEVVIDFCVRRPPFLR